MGDPGGPQAGDLPPEVGQPGPVQRFAGQVGQVAAVYPLLDQQAGAVAEGPHRQHRWGMDPGGGGQQPHRRLVLDLGDRIAQPGWGPAAMAQPGPGPVQQVAVAPLAGHDLDEQVGWEWLETR